MIRSRPITFPVATTFILLAGVAAAHNPGSAQDSHAYMGAWGDIIIFCRIDEDHAGPERQFYGWGGWCFDFGTDLAGGSLFRFRVEDEHGQPVGGIFRVVEADMTRLISNTPYCVSHPPGGGYTALPNRAFRIYIFIQEAGSVVNCLGHGTVGVPATRGAVTIETAWSE